MAADADADDPAVTDLARGQPRQKDIVCECREDDISESTQLSPPGWMELIFIFKMNECHFHFSEWERHFDGCWGL